jgi:hypothetical protein
MMREIILKKAHPQLSPAEKAERRRKEKKREGKPWNYQGHLVLNCTNENVKYNQGVPRS